jgi:GNAT superfamily N-acetyltransferase
VAQLAWLSVVEPEQGLGVGRRLLASFEELARHRGADRLVAASFDGVAGFLRARGWRDSTHGLVRHL